MLAARSRALETEVSSNTIDAPGPLQDLDARPRRDRLRANGRILGKPCSAQHVEQRGRS